jgi:hypothetical protein
VSRAHFFSAIFLHAELQDPQIEKHAKNNTKTGHSIKHVLKQQTEVQFVVFAYLGFEYLYVLYDPCSDGVPSAGCLARVLSATRGHLS